MKKKIEEKINQMRCLAATSEEMQKGKINGTRPADDSLSKAIRNPEEAAIFLAELEAAVKIAKAKS